jgi:hypothetical protein
MKSSGFLLGCVAAWLVALPLAAFACDIELKPVALDVKLRDGSQLKVKPVHRGIRVHSRLGGEMDLFWATLKEMDFKAGEKAAVVQFGNGDRLTVAVGQAAVEVDSALGRLKVPLSEIEKIVVTVVESGRQNVALDKPVHGDDGASHGKGLAKHVTDGDPETHAKPPASSFDYRIDLQNGAAVSYCIDEIHINWGRFGDQFKGVRQTGGEGWASGSWPGEYVTSYAVQYRKHGEQDWREVHQFQGRPVNEDADGVEVRKEPAKSAGCSSESETLLKGLNLRGVAQLRIRAKGSHWIGLYELKAYGWEE